MIYITSLIGNLKILIYKLRVFLKKLYIRKRQRKYNFSSASTTYYKKDNDSRSELEAKHDDDEDEDDDDDDEKERKNDDYNDDDDDDNDDDLFPTLPHNCKTIPILEKQNNTDTIYPNTIQTNTISDHLKDSIFPEIDFSQFDPNSGKFISILPCFNS